MREVAKVAVVKRSGVNVVVTVCEAVVNPVLVLAVALIFGADDELPGVTAIGTTGPPNSTT
jgi:hypothetical protein